MNKYVARGLVRNAGRGYTLIACAVAALALLGGMTTARAVDPETADLNDNGRVDIFDLRKLLRQRGLQSGELGYLEGQDLVPDSVINTLDVRAASLNYRQAAATTNTTLSGRVFDAEGHVLEGVKVFVGPDPAGGLLGAACVVPLCTTTNVAGEYTLNIPDANTGETQISFVGNAVVDPSPDELSSDFATVPHKPIFINGGTDVVFRDMIVPERNLVGSTDLRTFNATDNGGNSFTLLEDLVVGDPLGRATIRIPASCTITVPVGEQPVLSYTAIASDTLPVAMAPGQDSDLFGTFQPADTRTECPGGLTLTAELDNLDGYSITPPPPLTQQQQNERPTFMGVSSGVYQIITTCSVDDDDGNAVDGDVNDVIRCNLATPFVFAWHGSNCANPRFANPALCAPCERTTVSGFVKDFTTTNPIAGATVSIPGKAPVITDTTGSFSIPDVFAGPIGPRCTSNPARIRANASGIAPSAGPDVSVSALVSAVSGGITDVGTILLGDNTGTVQGRTGRLIRIAPVFVDPLAGTVIELIDSGFTVRSTTSDSSGNYTITNVDTGAYSNMATGLFTQVGSITDPNVPEIDNFRATGTGTINVTFNNVPAGFTFGRSVSAGGIFDGTFVIQASSSNGDVGLDDQQPNNSTPVTFLNVPMGACRLSIVDDVNNMERSAFDEIDGCFINEDGQVLNVVVDATNYGPSKSKTFSGAFTFFAIGSIGLTAVARRRRKA